MTPEQALQILREATEPAVAGKITRAGYVTIDMALQVIGELVASLDKKDQSDDEQ
jgi:hypothetical protein